jgi:hypothetical protein
LAAAGLHVQQNMADRAIGRDPYKPMGEIC